MQKINISPNILKYRLRKLTNILRSEFIYQTIKSKPV